MACWKSFLCRHCDVLEQVTTARPAGVRLHLSIGGAKAIVDADIASSIQPNARAVIASSISWATRFSTPGFLRLISCNVSAAPSSYVLLLPFRAARRRSRVDHLERRGIAPGGPHPRGWLDVETCAPKRQFAKGPGESPRACSRSVPQVSNGSDAQNGRARRRLFHWDDFCALLLIRVNASNRPQAGGYPPYTLYY